MIGTVWSNVTCVEVGIGRRLCAVCAVVFGLRQRDGSSVFVCRMCSCVWSETERRFVGICVPYVQLCLV